MKAIPLIIASRRMKYLRINEIKELLSLYTENYKTLVRKKKKDLNE